MATIEEAARLALALPRVTEGERHGNRSWSVEGKTFAWERHFSMADIKRFGAETPPDGPILAVRVADLHEKQAILAAGHKGFLTIPHFDGYAGLLIHLRKATMRPLREVLEDAWLGCAPPALVEEYLTG